MQHDGRMGCRGTWTAATTPVMSSSLPSKPSSIWTSVLQWGICGAMAALPVCWTETQAWVQAMNTAIFGEEISHNKLYFAVKFFTKAWSRIIPAMFIVYKVQIVGIWSISMGTILHSLMYKLYMVYLVIGSCNGVRFWNWILLIFEKQYKQTVKLKGVLNVKNRVVVLFSYILFGAMSHNILVYIIK